LCRVALTLGLLLRLTLLRRDDLQSGAVHPSQIALASRTDSITQQVANCFALGGT